MAIEALIKPAKLLTVRKMGCLGLVAGLWFFALNTQAATGSWSSQVPSVMVAMSDRTSSSQAITPPAGVPLRNAVLSRIQWRFESPPGTPVNVGYVILNAVLHYQACAVARPLYRDVGERTAVLSVYAAARATPCASTVLQVIVNYQ